jgi:hypothetical protein
VSSSSTTFISAFLLLVYRCVCIIKPINEKMLLTHIPRKGKDQQQAAQRLSLYIIVGEYTSSSSTIDLAQNVSASTRTRTDVSDQNFNFSRLGRDGVGGAILV